MIITQFKFAFKSLFRKKTFSLINVAGLTFSITAFILMCLYVENEWSYDKFNTKAQDIYRVVDTKQTNALLQKSAGSSGPVAPALLKDFPEIIQAARIINNNGLMKYDQKQFQESNIFFADPAILKILDFPFVHGDPNTALNEPLAIVLTKSASEKYFGKLNPIGKTLSLDGKLLKITGLLKDIPSTSHLKFDFLISMKSAMLKNSGYDWLFSNWYSNNFWTYILLQPNYNPEKIVAKLEDFSIRNNANTADTKHHFDLEKLRDIYLNSGRENQPGKTGNLNNIYIFSAIAFFIILIACINFINLSTAKSADRAKEVAIKKVNGVSRMQLVAQFYLESMIMVALAIVLSVVSAILLLPSFNLFAETNINIQNNVIPHLIYLSLIFIIVSFASGSYPALILSAFDPVSALKGSIHFSSRSILLRKGLVVFQFSISIGLIVCSLVVHKQLRFMQNYELGFKTTEKLIINFEGDKLVQSNLDYIKRELGSVYNIESISASSMVPGAGNIGGWSMDIFKKDGDTIHTELPVYLTDFTFLDQYMIPMVAGRQLSVDFAADTVESMIINETSLIKLGFNNAEEALGVVVKMYPQNGKIIGVFKDFHHESLQKAISPLAIRIMPDRYNYLTLNIGTGDISRTINEIDKTWLRLAPQRPLVYAFLDETYNRQYKSEAQFGKIFSVFTMLAISIACFGLFGLALYSVNQRAREIGIRKVIGASSAQIANLISKDFIKLVIMAMLLGLPISGYLMHNWLEGFAYRTNVGAATLVVSGFIALVVALATVGYHSVKASMKNPVISLKQ